MPWIVFWISVPINIFIGSLIAILVSALIPLTAFNNKLTLYDNLSIILVATGSIAALCGLTELWLIPISYVVFGLMWIMSLALKVPLTAHYSCEGYGGQAAFENQLFMKTNSILTLAWGGLYIITAVATFYLFQTSIASYAGLMAMVPPVFMGIFTVWFQKWYPAHYASK